MLPADADFVLRPQIDDVTFRPSSTQHANQRIRHELAKQHEDEVENNEFNVYGKNGMFYWSVYGMRNEILVEPDKTSIVVNGDGPYKWY